MIRPGSFLSLLILLSQVVVRSEILPLSLILDADSEEVHYVRGWLEAPAHVDLSQVKFLTTVVPSFDDDFFKDDDGNNDGKGGQGDDDWDDTTTTVSPSYSPGAVTGVPAAGGISTPSPSSANSSGGSRSSSTEAPKPAPGGDTASDVPTFATGSSGLETSAPSPIDPTDVATPAPSNGGRRRRRNLVDDEGNTAGGGDQAAGTEPGGGAQKVKQILDVVLFRIPDDCKKNIWGGCDWSSLGVGVRDEEVTGGLSYCCSENTVADNKCNSDMMGRLMIDSNVFQGEHRTIEVPTDPDQEFYLEKPMFEVEVTGDYVLILANCDDYGMDVFSLGSMEWKSVKGFLPGEMFGLMFFYIAMTIVYLLLVLWYWCGMKMYQDAAIPIQKFILATMLLGLLEFFFRATDLGIWNIDGLRSMGIIWSAVIIGVLKRGISRCLFVMVSMGWGVVRDSLGLALVKIIILGMTYCGLTMVRDFFLVLAVDKMESWSANTEEELLDLTLLVSLAVVAVNLIFFFWIISSLYATTEYLKNMGQTTKLRRHLRLRSIIMIAFFISLAWFVFSIIDGVSGILSSDQVWMFEATMHLNNLFVILGVAILWRPNSNAKDYAMQMELPAMGDDGENELELSCVVPSAGEFDEDGNDPDHPNGLPVDDAVIS